MKKQRVKTKIYDLFQNGKIKKHYTNTGTYQDKLLLNKLSPKASDVANNTKVYFMFSKSFPVKIKVWNLGIYFVFCKNKKMSNVITWTLFSLVGTLQENEQPVWESCVLLDLLVDELNAVGVGIQDTGRRRPEIAEYILTLLRLQDILHLHVTVFKLKINVVPNI